MRSFFRFLFSGCLLLAGCEDPLVDPFTAGKHFTVYGYLNAFDVDHYVRVVPVRRTPEDISTPDAPGAEIDAVVTSTDVSSNTPIRWTHMLKRLDDGSYGHVFSSRFVVRQGHRYRLVIRRSDGVETTAETTVPNLGPPTVHPARITPDSVGQLLTWPDAGIPDNIEVKYCAKPVGSFSCNNVVVHYGRAGRRTVEGWEVPVALSRDLLFVRQQLGYANSVEMELSSAEMWFTSLDEDWLAPQGAFDPIVFGQPDALTNVENGFGYWGSLARTIQPWMPDAAALDVLGYRPPA